MIKVLAIIRGCKECPKRQYGSGGIYDCSVVQQELDAGEVMPGWCPLPDHPAAAMVAQAARIKELERRLAASDSAEGGVA
ncbi:MULTISPECIES: hypothetical protein [Paraburkholderia]|uniref:Uncharacterized protein n=1 Tax=Paraburkholderia hospita TaxID=169430 RepID=A0AAN1J756_9BURK|nr:hypothetical protein [Paraburkholderia hospita]AUT68563.1 hypothetical protein C2L64_09670 [Paraburkholderia hospita]SEI27998.1 hypothetical protein SAMN05192544_11047 [Paraburkholderia hospita]